MPVGGAETLLVNLLDRLDRRRFSSEVICLKEAGPLGEAIADRIPVHTPFLSRKWDVRVLPRLIKHFRGGEIDAVITVGAGDKMFWGRLAAWLAGVPVIGSALHSTGWPDGVGRMNRWLTPLTDFFIAVADSHGEFMRQVERFPADKVHVVRNGIATNRFRPDEQAAARLRRELGIAPTAPLVGTVAALRPEKNHRMFVEVGQSVLQQYPHSHFVIVGDGPERAAIEEACRNRDVIDRVHLLGTRHDTDQILPAFDLFLLTSDNEASPVSILEALACEVPVVSTDVGSISETVVENETGSLVPVRDAAAMTAAVCRLLGDPAARRAWGQAGRQRVVATASLQAMVEGYERLIAATWQEAMQPNSAPWPASLPHAGT
jgi:glycosyltransferase involved in cell wall biosynthesis